MDINTMAQLVSTIGYPIVTAFILMYYVKYQADSHAKEMNSIKEALENNTLAVTKLCTMMEDRSDD